LSASTLSRATNRRCSHSAKPRLANSGSNSSVLSSKNRSVSAASQSLSVGVGRDERGLEARPLAHPLFLDRDVGSKHHYPPAEAARGLGANRGLARAGRQDHPSPTTSGGEGRAERGNGLLLLLA